MVDRTWQAVRFERSVESALLDFPQWSVLMRRIGHRAAGMVCVLASVVSLLGCHVGPDPCVPSVEMQPFFRHLGEEVVQQETADLKGWWHVFEDPTLNVLIEEAATQNLTLRQASQRILEARSQRGVVRADRLPQIDTEASYMFQKFSTNSAQFGIFGGGGGFIPGIDATSDRWNYGLNGSWEIDVFGRVFRQIEAADADIGASVWDYRDVLVILLSDVASNYVQVRTFQERIKLAQGNLEKQKEALVYFEKRLDGGADSRLPIYQQQSVVFTTEAAIPTLQANLQAAINRLSTLLGRAPGHVDALLEDAQPIPSAKYELAYGIPADLLRRRPDIRRAERQLSAQMSRIGVAVGDLYPRFSITGNFGFDAQDLSQLFTTTGSVAMIGPAFRWDILTFGRIRNNIRVQESRAEQLVAAYRQQVLVAAEEVDNALISYDRELQRQRALQGAIEADQNTIKTIDQSKDAGANDALPLIDAQRQLLISQDSLATSKGNIASNLIALYRALGGGWQGAYLTEPMFPIEAEDDSEDEAELIEPPPADDENAEVPQLLPPVSQRRNQPFVFGPDGGLLPSERNRTRADAETTPVAQLPSESSAQSR
ncbi:MAG: transporter [Blastopirellula sp.]|nr:transporter [Blastopirellula sp.]